MASENLAKIILVIFYCRGVNCVLFCFLCMWYEKYNVTLVNDNKSALIFECSFHASKCDILHLSGPLKEQYAKVFILLVLNF